MFRGTEFCPWHEYDWTLCCDCCAERRVELRRIDNQLRAYWAREGYSFADRGRSEWGHTEPHLELVGAA